MRRRRVGEGFGFLLGGGAVEVFGGAGALLVGAELFSGAEVGAFDVFDGVAAGFFDVEGAADFDGAFEVSEGEGVLDGVSDAVLDGDLLGAFGRSLSPSAGEEERSAGAVGAAALRQQVRSAARAYLVGGGRGAGGVRVAAGDQARGDGHGADGHSGRDAEESGPDRYGGLLPACAPGPGKRPWPRAVSGGACGGSSMASHALCLPDSPDVVATSRDCPVC
ncbi:hypothetical protein SBADM41S_08836 [Streptomyces badius]